jgi:hypothetical protein
MLLSDVLRILPREDNKSSFASLQDHPGQDNHSNSFYSEPIGIILVRIEVKLMSLSQDYNNLFRLPDISDQLRFMQSLLDSKDLTPAEAIALLNIIRVELEAPQPHRSSVYRRYAQVMQSLSREMPDVHEQVVQAWEAKKANLQTKRKPAENLAGSLLNLDDKSAEGSEVAENLEEDEEQSETEEGQDEQLEEEEK